MCFRTVYIISFLKERISFYTEILYTNCLEKVAIVVPTPKLTWLSTPFKQRRTSRPHVVVLAGELAEPWLRRRAKGCIDPGVSATVRIHVSLQEGVSICPDGFCTRGRHASSCSCGCCQSGARPGLVQVLNRRLKALTQRS